MAYGTAIEALADPTRRAVFERLRDAPLSVGDLAAELPVSRPAVSQHLRVLEAAGLVACTQEGTRRIYRVDAAGLSELRTWIDGFWDDVLGAFASEATRSDRSKRPPTKRARARERKR